MNSLIKQWEKDAKFDIDAQSLIMTNSALACDKSILPRLEKAAKNIKHDAVKQKRFVSFTGDCGLMLKMYLMQCFCNPNNDTISIWCMPCTSAANCGVSSKHCKQCYRYGPVQNLYDLVQEAGRVDRLHNGIRGDQNYRVYLNVTTFIT